MKKTIFNVYVVMDSQVMCDRMKQVCINNGLPIWDIDFSFRFSKTLPKVFEYDTKSDEFYCNNAKIEQPYQATETEFLQLLKEYKDEQ